MEDLSGQLRQLEHSAAGSSSTVNDDGPQPGCSHWPERSPVLSDGGNRTSVTPRVGETSMAQRLEAEEESDPEYDPGDLVEGHELPDIENDHDISDEEYDIPVRQCKDRLVIDLSSAMAKLSNQTQ